MSLLLPHVAFDPHETLLSYAARLSAFHTGLGMERLLEDLGISVPGFISGKPEEVVVFAESTGNAVDMFLRAAITVCQRHVEFRGERLSKEFLSPRALRFCAACLAETPDRDDWCHQLIWCFRHVHRCARHGGWLVPAPMQEAVDLRQSVDEVVIEAGCGAPDDVPEHQLWLAKRLSAGDDATCWLGGQTLEQVLAASEMIGAVLEFGHKVRPTMLSVPDQEMATDIGFSIYREGPEAVSEALSTIREASPAKAVQAGPLAMYGTLFDWLDRRCNAMDPGPIRDILRDHIVKYSAVDRGESVLGVEISRRRFHTLQSLSREVGIERRRLSRLLQKLGQVPDGLSDAESGLIRFEADDVTGLIEAFRTAVPFHEAAEYIDASDRQVEALYAAGIVQPLVPRRAPGSVRNVVFARRQLDEFLAKIEQLPVVEEHVSASLNTISYACQRGGGTTAEVVQLVFDGKLAARRLPGKPGLRQVLLVPFDAINLKETAA